MEMNSSQTGAELYPICYVVADDDEEELLLMRLALTQQAKPLPVREFTDGQQVVDYLIGNGALREDEDTHWLVVLDMNMPKLDGLETVRAIRRNTQWNSIPILLFVDQQNSDLIQQALASGANGCVAKPTTMAEYGRLFDEVFASYL